MKTMTKKRAFTLIELLIVIAIIGILFIVLVSKVDFATDKAKATGVQTDFRSFQVAIETVAKENAGLSTFGWDTGDVNGDRVRNSYDKGDTNKNGKQDPGEIFVGSKTYGEEWTNICTLTNPTDANDKSAIAALEAAINKNLDPKLYITIHDDLTITMANGAQDPWNTEYHGYYITNAVNDNKDRGAIVLYSNGANQEWGSDHSILNGIVVVNVPGNNVYGKDDYSIATVYTYVNGYGEVKTTTTGFGNTPVVDASTDDVTDNTNETIDLEPGLYTSGTIELYNSGYRDLADRMTMSWDELVETGYFTIIDGVLQSGTAEKLSEYGFYYNVPYAPDYYDGYIFVFKEDGYIDLYVKYCIDFDNLIFTTEFISSTSMNVLEYIVEDGVKYCTFEISELGVGYDTMTVFNVEGDGTYIPFPDGSLYMPDPSIHVGNNISGDMILPTNSITTIAKNTFGGTLIESIVVPTGVTNIGDNAFSGCENLTKIELPSTLTYIGEKAFYSCKMLQSIDIPDKTTYIGPSIFYDCINLREVRLSEKSNIQSIPDNAFTNCSSLTNINLSSTIKSIGFESFKKCTNLQTVEFYPNASLETIHIWAFEDCTNLKSITIPETTIAIAHDWIDGCNLNIYYEGSLEQWLYISFEERWGITPYYGYNLYINNSLLEEVLIPNTIDVIAERVFYGCNSIKHITIPNHVQEIGNNSLSECKMLETVIFEENSTLTTIEHGAFYGDVALKSIKIPSSVTYFSNYVFYNCSNLETAEFEEGIQLDSIPSYTFYGCRLLKTIQIPYGVTTIGNNAFYGCYGLTSIGLYGSGASLELPDTITKIEPHAFAYCVNVVTATIPSNLESIGYSTFYNCTALTTVTMLSVNAPTVTSSGLFTNCSSLTRIVVPTTSVSAYKSASYWSSYKSKIVAAS